MKKDSITESDLVLIYIEDKPAFYGRVEQITADVKPKWWRVEFLFLTFPHQITTWTIDDEQIRGAEFTMGGTPVRIEKLVVNTVRQVSHLASEQKGKANSEGEGASERKARVLSLANKDSM